MKIADSFQMAIATLAAHKLRSSLTVLGLVIGNAAVIALVSVGEGAKHYTQSQLNALGTDVLTVFSSNADVEGSAAPEPNLVLTDAEAIKTQLPAVAKVAPLTISRLVATYDNQETQTKVEGTTPDFRYVRHTPVASGRFFNVSEQEQYARVVVLGSGLAQKLFAHQNPLGKEVQINNLSFEVVGVMQARGSLLGEDRDNVAFVPITTMATQVVGRQSTYGIPLDYIEVSAQNAQSIRAAAFQMTNLLTRRHGKLDFEIQSQKAFLELTAHISDGLSLLLAAIASISLLVGGIGVMNIMLVSVSERTQEIGLRKAIGATSADILVQFLIESIILCLMGGAIGTGMGMGSLLLGNRLTPFQAEISGEAIALSLIVSGSIGVFFGVIPARQAAQLDPLIALNR
jgi:putative ABC transport system permease protein